MGFKEFKESAKPAALDRATMAASKMPFCIMGEPTRHDSEYKGQPQIQFLADIIYLDESGRRQSTNVFLPGNKFFQNFMEGLKDHPEYKHNLFLCMDGKAYDIDQGTGVCPCKHGTNGHTSSESNTNRIASAHEATGETYTEVAFYTPDGEPVTGNETAENRGLNIAPGSMTDEQEHAILTLCIAQKKSPPTEEELVMFSEKQAERYILRLRASAMLPSK
jgi:hypothetical protein